MKASALKYTILTVVLSSIVIVLALIPFQAFLTVWLASGLGHYTAVRLWKEVLLLICVLGVAYLMFADIKVRTHTLPRRLVQLIMAYVMVQIVWGIVAYKNHAVTAKALGYGWIVDIRFLAFFLVTWAVTLRTARLRPQWQRLILWPAVVVIVFGLLQVFVLPRDFLSHFGYGAQTISPYETINHNLNYVRIASTLRGANPLGAYLVIPISVLLVYVAHGGRDWRRLALLAAAFVTLFFSFSRSAWIGAAVSCLIILLVGFKPSRIKRSLTCAGVVAIILLAALGIGLRHNVHFENYVLHTQQHSAVKSTSDMGHTTALKSGLHDLLHQPLGRGPGTAGPASEYNNKPPRIAENYFIQIGQETGWLGLLLFLLINTGVGYLLWLRRRDPLALSLFASLVGLSFVNLLAHAWADDTLAYVWWGLAGMAMVMVPPKAEAAVSSPRHQTVPGSRSKKKPSLPG
jgi:hypothetical protein